ncbi:MAG: hypothetical protein DRO67_08060 [Candidatus Asgardarchaeum californiense]|nr:MAG: hypothetical protein DRO67_08060 [Candidatus Asgardarchaeum californiense]
MNLVFQQPLLGIREWYTLHPAVEYRCLVEHSQLQVSRQYL